MYGTEHNGCCEVWNKCLTICLLCTNTVQYCQIGVRDPLSANYFRMIVQHYELPLEPHEFIQRTQVPAHYFCVRNLLS
jgi:hypothetical protein